VKSTFLLDVVIRKRSAILELFSSKDQPLLVWGDSLLILDLGLHVLYGIRRLHLKGDGFTSQGLHEDLHSSSEPENKVESTFLLDVVIRKCSAVFQLLTGKDQSLLVWGDSLLILDLSFDILDGI